jgi:hypothetical protein
MSHPLSDTLDKILEFRHREIGYPEDHVPALRVPVGGSCCANCRFVSEDKKCCSNHYFRRWHGSDELPWPADRFCSDWWEACR